ncbi:glycosyltransferase family 22 protein [Piedraia hortae CBS 480.64]|uniref:Mannosyltransferase n=1 Tax=Piedraia hortae CBS 480.64 TaxID=1314780 RepID=A0A6A7C130_9PEZI|nr:glycosyltransferase family 22 protein [Piedraia hortae CBS 480.64]
MLRVAFIYLVLVLVRLYFALAPSYIHPDEHFQGPEVIVGQFLGWPSFKTWEFTSEHPIRSIFPLWIVYGPPLVIFKLIAKGIGHSPSPTAVFYTLRTYMFLLSFVLEDWALHELLPVKRERVVALLLVASSYVTWTYQVHTFSNSIETLIVLWCLVLLRRLIDNTQKTQTKHCATLAALCVLGIFNRITFPAFLLSAGLETALLFFSKPWRLYVALFTGVLCTLVAIELDTAFYTNHRLRLRDKLRGAVFTPYNNLLYNMDPSNLAHHGLHPLWQHFTVNLIQLLGPAVPLIALSSRKDMLFRSGIGGIVLLSCFRHQEPRFLLPAVPLLLASIKLPTSKVRVFVAAWAVFNTLASIIFGIFHQGGVVPAQSWISKQANVTEAIWWKTYSPPRWLLGEENLKIITKDLMGSSNSMEKIYSELPCQTNDTKTLLIIPSSRESVVRETFSNVSLKPEWHFSRHIGLDDLDFEQGVWTGLRQIIDDRGLTVLHLSRQC